MLLIDDKECCLFPPTFSYFFVMADDYLFSSHPADLRMLSVRPERLFTVF